MVRRFRYVGLGLLGLVLVALIVIGLAVPNRAKHRGGSSGLPFGTFAGYVWHGRVASVQASWTMPRIVSGSPLGFAATWIGAQGPGALRPFIQIGANEQRGLSRTGGDVHAQHLRIYAR